MPLSHDAVWLKRNRRPIWPRQAVKRKSRSRCPPAMGPLHSPIRCKTARMCAQAACGPVALRAPPSSRVPFSCKTVSPSPQPLSSSCCSSLDGSTAPLRWLPPAYHTAHATARLSACGCCCSATCAIAAWLWLLAPLPAPHLRWRPPPRTRLSCSWPPAWSGSRRGRPRCPRGRRSGAAPWPPCASACLRRKGIRRLEDRRSLQIDDVVDEGGGGKCGERGVKAGSRPWGFGRVEGVHGDVKSRHSLWEVPNPRPGHPSSRRLLLHPAAFIQASNPPAHWPAKPSGYRCPSPGPRAPRVAPAGAAAATPSPQIACPQPHTLRIPKCPCTLFRCAVLPLQCNAFPNALLSYERPVRRVEYWRTRPHPEPALNFTCPSPPFRAPLPRPRPLPPAPGLEFTPPFRATFPRLRSAPELGCRKWKVTPVYGRLVLESARCQRPRQPHLPTLSTALGQSSG